MKMRLVQSIKGKILLMGGVAIAASVILGSGGITALNKNSRNNEVLKKLMPLMWHRVRIRVWKLLIFTFWMIPTSKNCKEFIRYGK